MWARRPFGLVSPAVKPASRSHASASLIVRVLNINQSRALSWHMMFHSQCGLWNERYPVDGSTSVPSSCNARSSHVRNLCSIHWIREKPRALQRTDQRKANRCVQSPVSSNCCSGKYLLPIHPNPSFRNVSPINGRREPRRHCPTSAPLFI